MKKVQKAKPLESQSDPDNVRTDGSSTITFTGKKPALLSEESWKEKVEKELRFYAGWFYYTLKEGILSGIARAKGRKTKPKQPITAKWCGLFELNLVISRAKGKGKDFVASMDFDSLNNPHYFIEVGVRPPLYKFKEEFQRYLAQLQVPLREETTGYGMPTNEQENINAFGNQPTDMPSPRQAALFEASPRNMAWQYNRPLESFPPSPTQHEDKNDFFPSVGQDHPAEDVQIGEAERNSLPPSQNLLVDQVRSEFQRLFPSSQFRDPDSIFMNFCPFDFDGNENFGFDRNLVRESLELYMNTKNEPKKEVTEAEDSPELVKRIRKSGF